MRDRLIELLYYAGRDYDDYCDECREGSGMSPMESFEEYAADYLLSEGVIVPPCKVGQTIFFYTCVCDKEGEEKFDILDGEVVSFSIQKEGLLAYCRYKCGLTYWHLVKKDFGKTVFTTRAEAERALAERSKE